MERTTPTNNIIKRVGVIGLGCIGGSAAMSLKNAGYHVVGVDTHADTVRQCIELGVIVEGGSDLALVKGCGVVIIAVPLEITSDIISAVFDVVGESAIISDTGSVKGAIMANLPKGIRFVGGHPMTGSEQGGIMAAKPHLYKNAYYVLCGGNDEDRLTVQRLVEQMGAVPIIMDADSHDQATSKISHLPHMVAYSLVVSALSGSDEMAAKLAAGGFRDITRIASSDGALWVSVASLNKTKLLDEMDAFAEQFAKLRRAVADGDKMAMSDIFGQGKALRDNIDPHKGMGIYKVTMDIEDRPGIIGEVTTLLGKHSINLKNLGIAKSRSDGSGALSLEFWEAEDKARAAEVLTALGIALR